MEIVGRQREQELLATCLESPRPEFVAVYGRRRVGKTFLVREFFKNRFAFYASGVAGAKTRGQLKSFHESLREVGCSERALPRDWFEAFARLRRVLEDQNAIREPGSGKLVVFLDELPWMDTPRSDFRAAFDRFWNMWASARPDLLLIVCGSATSWMIDNLIDDHGGFYNRVTVQIALAPFTLRECEELLSRARTNMTRRQVMECYMVFGGIPYYLNLIDRKYSLAQNIDQLCFSQTGQLRFEFDRLYQSLFRHSDRHVAIVRALVRKSGGLLRTELAAIDGIGDGQPLTRALRELEQCGFVRKYRDFTKANSGHIYQLIDPFTLFHLRFLDNESVGSWIAYHGTPAHAAWRGYAFELVCLLHVEQIKRALGIWGIETREMAWRAKKDPRVQIDLLIDRRDDVISVCEMKFARGPFAIGEDYAAALTAKLDAFTREAKPRKSLHLTMITAEGVARNAYYDVVQREIIADDLFAD